MSSEQPDPELSETAQQINDLFDSAELSKAIETEEFKQFRSSMRNLLDKASAAQSLDDHRLMGSLYIPAALLPRSASHAQGIGCRGNHKAIRISSPVADEAEFVVPIEAGKEHSVAATKTVIGSMAAGAGLVAELTEDRALRSALDRLPERLHRALALDWSEIADDLTKASAVFVVARAWAWTRRGRSRSNFRKSCACLPSV